MANSNETTVLLNERSKKAAEKEKIQEETALKEKPESSSKMLEVIADEKHNMMDTRRNSSRDEKKLYEQMLLKEIPATNRPNEPTHAVLEGVLAESEPAEKHDTQTVRNHALIHYIATLAESNKIDDTFDFDFVESLFKNGSDINSSDKTGQTIFHEIARSWNIDVAKFLIKHGANVNQQDQFGRSPLHVAAAVNYAEMVEFLLKNGADVNIETYGEKQTPVHYAAKSDAENSLQMLLGYGGNVDGRDWQNRTPLLTAAEMKSSKTAKLLVSIGAPVGVSDNSGNSTLSLLIENIPEVALPAMDQFHSTNNINRTEFYFLNYLEGPSLNGKKTPAQSPLEVAVKNERYDIIMHPVMKRLIAVKWQIYGRRGAVQNLVLNLLYTIVWSVVGVTIPRHGRDLYFPLKKSSWRLVCGALIILFTLFKIKRQTSRTVGNRRKHNEWKEWRVSQLEQEKKYCHPRWQQERTYLESEIAAVRNVSLMDTSDWWTYFDWISLVLILANICTHVAFFMISTDRMKEIHHYTTIAMLLFLWFRMFKFARPFESAGPFVVILSHVVGDIAKWAILNSVIFIPFACAFWITFGAISLHPVNGYNSVSPLIYNIFSMMVVGDHKFPDLEKENPTMARLLCGSFIGIAAIVTLNLLIALLSNTFERLYENAVANAVMQRALTILLLEKTLGRKQRNAYNQFIKQNASPEVIQNKIGQMSTNPEDRATIDRVYDDVKMIKAILGERFGKRYGKGKISDIDFLKEDINKVKTLEETLANHMIDMKTELQGLGSRLALARHTEDYSNYGNNNGDQGNDNNHGNKDGQDNNYGNNNGNQGNNNNDGNNNNGDQDSNNNHGNDDRDNNHGNKRSNNQGHRNHGYEYDSKKKKENVRGPTNQNAPKPVPLIFRDHPYRENKSTRAAYNRRTPDTDSETDDSSLTMDFLPRRSKRKEVRDWRDDEQDRYSSRDMYRDRRSKGYKRGFVNNSSHLSERGMPSFSHDMMDGPEPEYYQQSFRHPPQMIQPIQQSSWQNDGIPGVVGSSTPIQHAPYYSMSSPVYYQGTQQPAPEHIVQQRQTPQQRPTYIESNPNLPWGTNKFTSGPRQQQFSNSRAPRPMFYDDPGFEHIEESYNQHPTSMEQKEYTKEQTRIPPQALALNSRAEYQEQPAAENSSRLGSVKNAATNIIKDIIRTENKDEDRQKQKEKKNSEEPEVVEEASAFKERKESQDD